MSFEKNIVTKNLNTISESETVDMKLLTMSSGDHLNKGLTVETFDAVENKWTLLKKIPISKYDFSVNLISNKILIIGGFKSGDLNLVDAIDLSTGTIQSFPPLKQARSYPSSVVVTKGNNEILYVLGGYHRTILSSVEKWDSLTNEWTEGIPMTTARHSHGCVFLHGYIYAVGGFEIKILNTVEAFNTETGIWKTVAPMNIARYNFGITTFKNQIYVVGGIEISTVERYDPQKNSWTTLANIQSNGLVGLCTLGERLICAGTDKNTAEEYDEDENTWISLPPKNMSSHDSYLIRLSKNAKLGNW